MLEVRTNADPLADSKGWVLHLSLQLHMSFSSSVDCGVWQRFLPWRWHDLQELPLAGVASATQTYRF